jgi:hypothetical protein
MKTTEPVGVPEVAGVTDAVKVMFAPVTEGLADVLLARATL